MKTNLPGYISRNKQRVRCGPWPAAYQPFVWMGHCLFPWCSVTTRRVNKILRQARTSCGFSFLKYCFYIISVDVLPACVCVPCLHSASRGELRHFYAIQDIIPKMMMATVMTMMITTMMISASTVPPDGTQWQCQAFLRSYRRLIRALTPGALSVGFAMEQEVFGIFPGKNSLVSTVDICQRWSLPLLTVA